MEDGQSVQGQIALDVVYLAQKGSRSKLSRHYHQKKSHPKWMTFLNIDIYGFILNPGGEDWIY